MLTDIGDTIFDGVYRFHRTPRINPNNNCYKHPNVHEYFILRCLKTQMLQTTRGIRINNSASTKPCSDHGFDLRCR